MAALAVGVPEWAHVHLLQPDSTPGSSSGIHGSPPSSSGSSSSGSSGIGQTLAALLRPLPPGQLQLGRGLEAGTNDKRAVFRGTVSGQPAVIKRYQLSSAEEGLKAAAEVRITDIHS